jgi:hypothetical protein
VLKVERKERRAKEKAKVRTVAVKAKEQVLCHAAVSQQGIAPTVNGADFNMREGRWI